MLAADSVLVGCTCNLLPAAACYACCYLAHQYMRGAGSLMPWLQPAEQSSCLHSLHTSPWMLARPAAHPFWVWCMNEARLTVSPISPVDECFMA